MFSGLGSKFAVLVFFLSCVCAERLLEIQSNQYIIVKDDKEKFQLSSKGVKYIDVTDTLDISTSKLLKRSEETHESKFEVKFWDKYQVFSFQDLMFDDSVLITLENTILSESDKEVRVNLPQDLTKQDSFNEIIASTTEEQLIKDMHTFIEHFTSFYNRFYKSNYGVQASNWIFEQLEFLKAQAMDEIPNLEVDDLISIEKFEHSNFPQYSILFKIKAKPNKNNKAVIIGSHIDSINLLFPYLLRAPGVDDNATGTCINYLILKTYLEALVSNSIEWPENDLEFHFYAGEEGGLLGSLDIFKDYKVKDKKDIMSVLVLDQIGHPDKNRELGLMTDFVSPDMVDFLEILIKSYTTTEDNKHVKYVKYKCGYGCSDHASAYKYGFPSGMISESSLKNDNKFTHSVFDTIDRVDFKWLSNYYRIGLSYLLELSTFESEL